MNDGWSLARSFGKMKMRYPDFMKCLELDIEAKTMYENYLLNKKNDRLVTMYDRRSIKTTDIEWVDNVPRKIQPTKK